MQDDILLLYAIEISERFVFEKRHTPDCSTSVPRILIFKNILQLFSSTLSG